MEDPFLRFLPQSEKGVGVRPEVHVGGRCVGPSVSVGRGHVRPVLPRSQGVSGGLRYKYPLFLEGVGA